MAGAGETKTGQILAGGEESGAGAEVGKTMFPLTKNPLVIRTGFSDQAAWEAIVTAIRTSTPDGCKVSVKFLDDPAFQGLTTKQVLALASDEYSTRHGFLMIVDDTAITKPEHPLVVANLFEYEEGEEPPHGREFRAVPAAIDLIASNMSVGTTYFEELAEDVSEDGVYQYFGEPTN